MPTYMHLEPPLVLYVCLSGKSGTKGTLHHLPTLQNNEPVSQVIETGFKPILLLLKHPFFVDKFNNIFPAEHRIKNGNLTNFYFILYLIKTKKAILHLIPRL